MTEEIKTKSNEEIVALRIESDLLEAWPRQFFDIIWEENGVAVIWNAGPAVDKVRKIAYQYSADHKVEGLPYVTQIKLVRALFPELINDYFMLVKQAWESVEMPYQATMEFAGVYGIPPFIYCREKLDNFDFFPCEKCDQYKCKCDE